MTGWIGDPLDLSPAPETWVAAIEDAAALLHDQMCPICGEGPWKSPLNHVARKHGIDRWTMRDICGLTTQDSVIDSELRQRFSERDNSESLRAATAANLAGQGRRKRFTRAGLDRQRATLKAWEEADHERARRQRSINSRKKTPEGIARSAAAASAWHAANKGRLQSPEIIAKRVATRAATMQSPEMKARLQGHGTVACYKRGCRCDECRAAKSESRRRKSVPNE